VKIAIGVATSMGGSKRVVVGTCSWFLGFSSGLGPRQRTFAQMKGGAEKIKLGSRGLIKKQWQSRKLKTDGNRDKKKAWIWRLIKLRALRIGVRTLNKKHRGSTGGRLLEKTEKKKGVGKVDNEYS